MADAVKYYDSMGFESEHGIWMRRVDAEARIRELEAALEKYQAARVHDVDEKNWLRDRVTELEAGNAILAAEVNRLNIAMCAAQSDAEGKQK